MISDITITRGTSEHLEAIRSMLTANDLPSADVAAHVENFLLAWSGSELVGTIAVELLGEDGVLRSLCVAPSFRDRGLGTRLGRSAEALARNAGVRHLYLLTTTAGAFFERAGDTTCRRESVPDNVGRTAEFSSLCPLTATCMVRNLDEDVSRGRPPDRLLHDAAIRHGSATCSDGHDASSRTHPKAHLAQNGANRVCHCPLHV